MGKVDHGLSHGRIRIHRAKFYQRLNERNSGARIYEGGKYFIPISELAISSQMGQLPDELYFTCERVYPHVALFVRHTEKGDIHRQALDLWKAKRICQEW